MNRPTALSEESLSRAGAVRVTGPVKWFDNVKGFGFLVPDDDDGDVLIHFSVLKEVGYNSLPEGATVICHAVDGPKGRQAIAIEEITVAVHFWLAPATEAMYEAGIITHHDSSVESDSGESQEEGSGH